MPDIDISSPEEMDELLDVVFVPIVETKATAVDEWYEAVLEPGKHLAAKSFTPKIESFSGV